MQDTIVALSTPFGVSAIAKIRVSGPATKSIITRHFSRNNCTSHTAFLGYYKNHSGVILDQVVALFFDAERSYTGEDALEIDCHGNPLIIRSILEDLQISECRIANPGEFTHRAYRNHRIDLCQAEAVLDVIHATNERALTIAQKQLQGSLSKEIFHLSDELLTLLAEIEARIDFSDEGIDFDDNIVDKLDTLALEINEIIDSHNFRKNLLHGTSVAIVGHPNAGKSSLLNALLGEERALVSDIPGTTRDFISENLVIRGCTIKIIDTAGLRTTTDHIEQLGIAKTIHNIQAADLCLLVIDRNNPQNLDENALIELAKKPCIAVINKADLPRQKLDCIPQSLQNTETVEISAKNKTNIDLLTLKIAEFIQKKQLHPQDDAIVINERHKKIFEDVRDLLLAAKTVINTHQPYELCASDLRLSLETLGYITGKYCTEEMLGHIFSHFCVGK